MPTTYTGSSTGIESPQGAPSLSASVQLSLPADTDARNAASVAQPFKALADFVAYLRTTLNGLVTGTISFASTLFQQSTLGTTPLARFNDFSGVQRFMVDHFGFPLGRRSEYRVEWGGVVTTPSSSGTNIVTTPLTYFTATNGSISFNSATTNYPAAFAALNPGTTISGGAQVATTWFALNMTSSMVAVMEWEASLGATINVGMNHWMGFSNQNGGVTGFGTGNPAAVIGLGASTSVWQTNVNNLGVTSTTQSITNAAYPNTQFRIELIGPSSLGGPVTRFYVNGILAQSVAAIPAGSLGFGFSAANTTTNALPILYVGPCVVTWARFNTSPSL